jgi:DNA-binding HxlR family transcriptional regulator
MQPTYRGSVRRKSFEDMRCSVAQTLEIVGEWWTLLIVRDLLVGVTRFDALQQRLGIARNILADRLTRLVETGVVERRMYQEHPERFEYRLTEMGADLWKVVTALREWGDRWVAPQGPPVELVHRHCGEVTHAEPVCAACGEPLHRRDIQLVPGPGAGDEPVLP